MEHSYTVLKLTGWELMQCKPNFIIELVSSRLAPFQLQAKFCHVPLQLWLNLIFLASKACFSIFWLACKNFFAFESFEIWAQVFLLRGNKFEAKMQLFTKMSFLPEKRARSKFRVSAVGRLGLESRRCLVTGARLWQLRGQFQLS